MLPKPCVTGPSTRLPYMVAQLRSFSGRVPCIVVGSPVCMPLMHGDVLNPSCGFTHIIAQPSPWLQGCRNRPLQAGPVGHSTIGCRHHRQHHHHNLHWMCFAEFEESQSVSAEVVQSRLLAYISHVANIKLLHHVICLSNFLHSEDLTKTVFVSGCFLWFRRI